MRQQPNVIMITGASLGLGKALTLHLAKQGHQLAICARNKKALEQVKREAVTLGAEVLAEVADVSKIRDVERFVSITENHFGRVDILINNASAFGPGPTLLTDYPDEIFKEVINVNILNLFYMTKRVLPGMLTRGIGKIISLTSETGRIGYAEWGAYSVSKFALEGLAAVWTEELTDTGVAMVLVDPGEMDTAMHEIAVPDCDYELMSPEEVATAFDYLIEANPSKVHGKRFEVQTFLKKGLHDEK
ncbi:SDR family oxidoreductase [Alkalihalophilus lindianensis]|uniref:SDR family oxidoreductase n=1 Tax=Alkalihalophilus lindianensis TaxID=1630542 RepID=A0ABU3XES3_9BACI|nr:SDR family oxidoreductase [Alkalihalophilus lindianensis]MDV2686338.1 SDR family oxidoreductase [Alkalihalophilus lindianensis]